MYYEKNRWILELNNLIRVNFDYIRMIWNGWYIDYNKILEF